MSERGERAGIEKREKQTIKSLLDLLNRKQYYFTIKDGQGKRNCERLGFYSLIS